MTNSLRLVVLREIPEDGDLRVKWNALVERVDRPQVFYTYEWAMAVQSAYKEALRPLVILAYNDSNLLSGVAALATPQEGQASFLCATTGDYCDFLSGREERATFVEAVLGELKKLGIDRMAFTNLPSDSPTLDALRLAAKGHGTHLFARSAYVCAQVAFERLELRKDGKRTAPGLKRLRRFEKAMGPAAPVRTEHVRSWETVKPKLTEFMQAHVGRFLELGRISNLADPNRQFFLAELARILPKEWLVLTRMWAGNKVVAWHYGFQFDGAWFWYQPTFDSSVEKHWPGFCLLSQVIQDALQIPGMTVLDLGLGSEAYKAKFANETRETLHVSLNDSWIAHWKTVGRYRLAEAVKSSPRLEHFVIRTRQKIVSLKSRSRSESFRGRLQLVGRRVLRFLWANDEILFYDMSEPDSSLLTSDGLVLRTIDLSTLAAAAVQNPGDEGTMAYLLRSAHRLRAEPESIGFVLTNASGELLHFTWARPFAGFHWSELNSELTPPCPNSVVMFDSWTPVAHRGRGYYGPTLGRAVARIRQNGTRAWGFSASTNTASVRGIEKVGFRRTFSVLRHRILWWQRIVRRDLAAPTTSNN